MKNYRFRGQLSDSSEEWHAVAAGPVTACGEDIRVTVGAEDAEVTCVVCLKRMAHEATQQLDRLGH